MKKFLVVLLTALFSHVAFAGDACKSLKGPECKKNAECKWMKNKCTAKPAAKSAKAAAPAAKKAAPAPAAPAETAPSDAMPADEGEDLEDM